MRTIERFKLLHAACTLNESGVYFALAVMHGNRWHQYR